jgi:uncharacterized protein (DUF488 family)
LQRGRPLRVPPKATRRAGLDRAGDRRPAHPGRRQPSDRRRGGRRAAGPVSGSGGEPTEVYTIGFTKKTASEFFGTIKDAGIKRLLDIRLNNSSRLAGFARHADLPFFLKELCGAEYLYEPQLTPTREILDAYRKGSVGWPRYEERFLELMRERRVEEVLDRSLFGTPTVLLCSEAGPEFCHRRLVLEYLDRAWGGIRAVHL